ncbi:MAG TPA: agmatinase [Thermoanaerobaculia bacterium]|nr:agmatinase [Thermoanaerobaculia bacterium]
MPYLPTNYGLLDEADSDYDRARAVVLPVPFERTVSYGHGTAAGPAAILRASQSMELYDEELASEPFRLGIATLPPFLPEAFDLGEALGELQAEAATHLAAGKFLVTLGGEHSLTTAPARAARAAAGGEIGIVQFDAHADLREEFEGTPFSHASVMSRLVEDGLSTLPVGIRSLSAPEAALIRDHQMPVIWGHELADPGTPERFERLLDALPDTVYLTFDIDYFDPALVPATGTPEPGGGQWWPTLALLRTLFQKKTVIAMDLVELAPLGGHPASDFLAAKLVYKCLAYLQEAEAPEDEGQEGGGQETEGQ